METALQQDNIIKTYSAIYEQNKNVFEENQPPFLKSLRAESIRDFNKLGLPLKKSERYKYTQLEGLFNKKYGFIIQPQKVELAVDDIFKCDVPELGNNVVLLLNGFYHHKNNSALKLPEKVWVGSLQVAIKEKPELVEKYLGKVATNDDGLIALNSAVFRDGVFIHIPKGIHMEKPLQVINVLFSEEDLFVTHRNLIVLEENSSANVVICDHSLSPYHYFTNSVYEIVVDEGANYHQTRLQNEHNNAAMVSSVFLHQERNSSVNFNNITLHGGLVRNNICVKLKGEGADSNITGLAITDKTQHVDNYVFIDHAMPHCTSNQLFKGVLDNTSTGAFTGRILVERDAQKTIAYQKNSNLLLTSDAKMSTRPQLEIYADDVKCSHGATVGQLDQDALFYMQTRGIGKKEARLLLMFAFAHEIIKNINVENLRFRIDELVNKRLRGELSKCHNCQVQF